MSPAKSVRIVRILRWHSYCCRDRHVFSLSIEPLNGLSSEMSMVFINDILSSHVLAPRSFLNVEMEPVLLGRSGIWLLKQMIVRPRLDFPGCWVSAAKDSILNTQDIMLSYCRAFAKLDDQADEWIHEIEGIFKQISTTLLSTVISCPKKIRRLVFREPGLSMRMSGSCKV